jgi:UrcA family protein
MRMKILIPSAIILLAAAHSGFAASAQPAPPKVLVAYADLDLGDWAGATTMLKRIRKAAATVCSQGPFFAGNDAETILRIDACFRQSVAHAVETLDAPLVTRAYAANRIDPVVARLP